MASAKGQLQNTLTLCLKTELSFFCKYIHFRCNIFNFLPYFKSAKYFNIQMYDGPPYVSPTFTSNLTSYIKLPENVLTSCWSAKSIVVSFRHSFMNFIQIERYKANADARSQFCHFVGNISK